MFCRDVFVKWQVIRVLHPADVIRVFGVTSREMLWHPAIDWTPCYK